MRGTPSGVNWYRPERSKISPLCWWAPLADQWPILHGLATILFNLPCSSSAAERVWSAADHIITKKRSRLSTDTSTKLISILWNERVLYKHKSSDLRKAEIPPHRRDLVALPFNYQWMTVPSSSASAPTANESNEDEYDEASYELDQAVEDNVDVDEQLLESEETCNTDMQPIDTNRCYSGPHKPFDQVRPEIGLTLLLWCGVAPCGWYSGIISSYDEVTKRYQINFDDDETYEMTTLSLRQYGPNKTWIVQA
jgi:hypothetical protein